MSRYRQRKGRRTESECVQILREMNYTKVYDVPTPHRHTKQKDIFNTFDVLAVGFGHHRYIQCKTNGTNGAKKEISEWLLKEQDDFPKGTIYEIWVRYDNKSLDQRWVIHTWNGSQWSKWKDICQQINYSCGIK